MAKFPGKKISTVKIKSKDFESGFVIINESDFDESRHELFKEKVKIIPADNKNLVTEKEAATMNRNQLREYAQKFNITGRGHEEIFEALKKSGKLVKTE